MVHNSVKECGWGRNCVSVTFDQFRIDNKKKKKGRCMKELNKQAASSNTFAKNYNKPILDESGNFSRTALESESCKYIYKGCNIY